MKIGFLMEGSEYSFARVVGFLLVLFYMYNATLIMLKTGQFIDLPWGVATLVLLSYGIGKAGEVSMANGQNKITLGDKVS